MCNDELGSLWQENVAYFKEPSWKPTRETSRGEERLDPVRIGEVQTGIRFVYALNINRGCNYLIQQNENCHSQN